MGVPLLLLLGAYLLGAIPFGFLIGKFNGIDIRQEGSGNAGATNVLRVLGKKWGGLCFFVDFMKGFLAIFLVDLFTDSPLFSLLALVIVILGHMYSAFLQFQGGKGVATCMGGLMFLSPYSLLGFIVIWVGLFYLLGYVSLASICGGLSLPILGIAELYIKGETYLDYSILLLFFIGFGIVFKHRSNIRRLIKGEEFSFKKAK